MKKAETAKARFPVSVEETLGLAGALSLAYTIAVEFGVSGLVAGLACFILFFLLTTLWAIARLWTYEGNRFKRFPSKNWKGAKAYLEDAETHICATHFSNSIPSDAYLAVMQEKLEDGVGVSRVVRIPPDSKERHEKWLERFRGKAGYRETIAEHVTLPFDLMVIDSRAAFMFLPTHAEAEYFDQAIAFFDPEVVRLFRNVFSKLEDMNRSGSS